MKTILVPTDFSPCADFAAHVAMDVARRSQSRIIFFHLSPEPAEMMARMTHAQQAVVFEEDKIALGHVKAKLAQVVGDAEKAGVVAKFEIAYDTGGLDLSEYTRINAIDFVVMGSHGSKGLKEMFTGSNTARFIRDTSLPTLVLKGANKEINIRNIVFASDFTVDFIRPFKAVLEFADLFQAKIHLLYVNTPARFKENTQIVSDMKRFMHQFPGVTYTSNIYSANEEAEGIHLFANANKIDVVALTTRGRGGMARIFNPSIAEHIINHEHLPVLVSTVAHT